MGNPAPKEQAFSPLLVRLTALWALAESGLGGYMHALGIPLTGIVIGGSAVIILSLIAYHTPKPFNLIIRATLIVLLVKFLVSPQTRFPAYIAVSFQGLMAALLFSIRLPRPVILFLFMPLCMLESAVQSVLIKTLFFGKQLWHALDQTAEKIIADFHLPAWWGEDFSFRLIGGYVLMYLLWGFLLAYFAWKLPGWISDKKERTLEAYSNHTFNRIEKSRGSGRKRKRIRRVIWVVFVILFVAGSYLIENQNGQATRKALLSISRTLAILLAYFYLFIPLIKKAMKGLSKRYSGNPLLQSVLNELPALEPLVPVAWTLAREQRGPITRYPVFLVYLILLSLYANESNRSV